MKSDEAEKYHETQQHVYIDIDKISREYFMAILIFTLYGILALSY